MRIELTPVRISGTLAGWGKRRASDDTTEAGTKSSGSRLSRHGSARIPAPSLEPLIWMGPAVRVVGASLDRAIPLGRAAALCCGASRSRGGSTTLVRNLTGSADPQWLAAARATDTRRLCHSRRDARRCSSRGSRFPISRTRLSGVSNERTATQGSSVRSSALPRHASTAAALGPQKLL